MKVERIDHIHVKCLDLDETSMEYEKVIGKEFMAKMDFTEDQGNRVAFNPFPIGLEVMQGTDPNKGSGVVTATSEVGVFAISLKVPDINEATAEMETMGFKKLWSGEFGEIMEALFDTKKALGVLIELIAYRTEDITATDNGGLS